MDQDGYLAHLRRDQRAFASCLRGDLSATVEHCPGWTLYDLADHLGRGNLWAAAAVTEQRGDHAAPAAPDSPRELVGWFDDACAELLRALGADPSTPAWTIAPPHTVGFWRRRRALEALVHRWDAEHALEMTPGLDPDLADDGVAEVVDTMAPRQVRLGRAPEPTHAVRLGASDTGSTWQLGPGVPVATVHARAEDLLLLLWGRVPADHETLHWVGDREAASSVLGSGLVP